MKGVDLNFLKSEDDLYYYNLNYNDYTLPEFMIECLNNNKQIPKSLDKNASYYLQNYNYVKFNIIKYE